MKIFRYDSKQMLESLAKQGSEFPKGEGTLSNAQEEKAECGGIKKGKERRRGSWFSMLISSQWPEQHPQV